MSEWVVTFTLADEPTMIDRLDRWVDQLDAIDAFAARLPHGVIDVTVHVSTDQSAFIAQTEAWRKVQDVIGGDPFAIAGFEVMTESEYERRAEAPTMPELVGAAEIADELGVSRQRVHQLRKLEEFPAPLAELGGGAIWDAAAVRKFVGSWTRQVGNPAFLAG